MQNDKLIKPNFMDFTEAARSIQLDFTGLPTALSGYEWRKKPEAILHTNLL